MYVKKKKSKHREGQTVMEKGPGSHDLQAGVILTTEERSDAIYLTQRRKLKAFGKPETSCGSQKLEKGLGL